MIGIVLVERDVVAEIRPVAAFDDEVVADLPAATEMRRTYFFTRDPRVRAPRPTRPSSNGGAGTRYSL
jgi:hypothetical protein